MGKSKNQAYIDMYAEMAMENMRLYGIPASVTLAQGILESGNGQSQLARKENNHFGIKASKSWIESGGRYCLYTDDKPNEKFCSYDSVLDSYAHHSRILANSSRYRACFSLDPADYKGWAWGLERGGYATAGNYAPTLINIIERNDLAKYDRMVIEQMKAQGLVPGQGTPALAQAQNPAPAQEQTPLDAQPEGLTEGNGNQLAEASSLSPHEWLRKLMSSEDSGLALQNGNDPIMEMMVMLFSTLMAFANQIDQKSQQEQMAYATRIAESRQIDLRPLLPGLRECTLTINDNQQPVLAVNNGSLRFQQALSPADMLRLNNLLSNDSLSAYDKQLGVAGIVNSLVLSRMASQNFDMAMQRGQSQNLTR